MVKEKIHERNKSMIPEMTKSYKNLEYEQLLNEEYSKKFYLETIKLSQARTCFAARAQTLRTVQMNFKHKPEYVINEWKCICGEDDFQSHLTSCDMYANLREGLDLERSDIDLVTYYQRVIRQREQAEELGRGRRRAGEEGAGQTV